MYIQAWLNACLACVTLPVLKLLETQTVYAGSHDTILAVRAARQQAEFRLSKVKPEFFLSWLTKNKHVNGSSDMIHVC